MIVLSEENKVKEPLQFFKWQEVTTQVYSGVEFKFGHLGSLKYLLDSNMNAMTGNGYHEVILDRCESKLRATNRPFPEHLNMKNTTIDYISLAASKRKQRYKLMGELKIYNLVERVEYLVKKDLHVELSRYIKEELLNGGLESYKAFYDKSDTMDALVENRVRSQYIASEVNILLSAFYDMDFLEEFVHSDYKSDQLRGILSNINSKISNLTIR